MNAILGIFSTPSFIKVYSSRAGLEYLSISPPTLSPRSSFYFKFDIQVLPSDTTPQAIMRSQLFNTIPWALLGLLSQSLLVSAIPNPQAEGGKCSKPGCLSDGKSPLYCVSGVFKSCGTMLYKDYPNSGGNIQCVDGQSPSAGMGPGSKGEVLNPRVKDAPYPSGTRVKVGTTPGGGPQFCTVKEIAGGKASCRRGGQMATRYDADPASNCQNIQWTPGKDYVAAYYWNIEKNKGKPTPFCGKKVDVKNPKTGKKLTVTVVDACPSCTGPRPNFVSTYAT